MQSDLLRGKSEELITNTQESVELVESFKEKKCLSSIEDPIKKVGWEFGNKDILEKYKVQSPKLILKHRKNCECCPGHHLIVDHYSSI